MATMYPNQLYAQENYGERTVFDLLKTGVGAEQWHVLHSLNLSRHVYQQMGEIDFVVVIPGKGLLVLEVKGSDYVGFDGQRWIFGQGPNPITKPISPFVQAKDNMISLRNYVGGQLSTLSGMAFGYCVVLPRCGRIRHPSPEWDAHHLITADDLARTPLPALLLKSLEAWRDNLRTSPSTSRWFQGNLPARQQAPQVVQLLRPRFEVFEPPSARAQRRDAELKRYSEVQFGALDSMSDNPRTLFLGPAGTGKTLLALEAARRALAQGKRVLLTCFNRALAERLRGQLEPDERLVVNTLQGHMMDVAGLTYDPTYDDAFWKQELPEKAIGVILNDTTGQYVFDEVIADEAQDLVREPFLDFLDLSTRNGLRGGSLRLFGDFDKQAIYAFDKTALDDLRRRRLDHFVRYRLYANCRNPRPIADRVTAWIKPDPGYTRVMRDEGFGPPQLLPYDDADEQVEALAGALEDLAGRGVPLDDIVILSARARESCAGRLGTPWAERLTPLEESEPGKIRYTTIHKFKGLEAPVVILTDVDACHLSRIVRSSFSPIVHRRFARIVRRPFSPMVHRSFSPIVHRPS